MRHFYSQVAGREGNKFSENFCARNEFLLNGFWRRMNEPRERNISSLCAPLDCHIVLNDGGGKTLPVCLYLCSTTAAAAAAAAVTFFISIEEIFLRIIRVRSWMRILANKRKYI